MIANGEQFCNLRRKPLTWGLVIIVTLTITLCIFDYAEFIDISNTSIPNLSFIVLKGTNQSNVEIEVNSIFKPKSTADYSEQLSSCIPHYKYVNEEAKKMAKKGDRFTQKTPIVLLAAFEYKKHLTVTTQNDGLVGSPVYCHYISKDFKPLGTPSLGLVYPFYVVTCCKREGAEFVSVTEHDYDIATNFVPITKRSNTTVYTLSVCLCPIYGNTSSWLLLTELIEHYKLQGVDHFYVYVKDMDSYSRKLLYSYIDSGDVEAIFLSNHVSRKGEEWQHIGINDCVVRSRFHSKYIISQDIDERLTPVKPMTLKDYVVNYFKAHANVGILSFRMRWILRDKIPPTTYEGNKTLTEHLPTLLYHNTSAPAPKGHTAKNIMDPLKVLCMWIHWADAMFPGFQGDYALPEDVEIRHYRDVIISDWGKRWMPGTLSFGNYTTTFYPAELQRKLFDNVKKRLDSVFL